MSNYYNTTNESGDHLLRRRRGATKQRDRILQIFQLFWADKFSPERICKGYYKIYGEEIDLNSCRRAITGLTDEGLLEKLGEADKVMGSKGVRVHQWTLAKCQSNCDPSNYHKDGKCAKNGCYKG